MPLAPAEKGPSIVKPSDLKPKPINTSLAAAIEKLVKGSLYEYQYDYVMDTNRMQCSLWCRGAGKSFSAGWKAAIRALDKKDDFVLVSASENQAGILLNFCKNVLDEFDQLFKIAVGRSVYAKQPGKIEIELFNGSKIVSLPANPRTVAGYTANIFWDEVAKTLNDDEMWRALGQCTRSYKSVDLMSSAWGAQGLFYEIMAEGKHEEFVLRNIDIHTAIRQGLPRSIDALRAMCDDFTWEQEYLNKFQSAVSSPFHPGLLKICSELRLPEPPPIGKFADGGKLQQYYVGVDLGRTNDKTAIAWFTEFPEGYLQCVKATKIADTPLPVQEKMIEEILQMPCVGKLAIDNGGLGMQMSESLGAKFPDKLIPYGFTMQSKSSLVTNALSRMEKSTVHISPACEQDIVYDLSLIQRTYTQVGNMVFGAKRNSSGHADGAWAFLLGMEAARQAGKGCFFMDFGLDQNIIDILDQEGSLRVNDILNYQGQERTKATMLQEQNLEKAERLAIGNYMGLLTGNHLASIFTSDEIGKMSNAELDFYGLPPRGKNHGNT